VVKKGAIVFEDGKTEPPARSASFPVRPKRMGAMHIKPFHADVFQIADTCARIRVMDVVPDQIATGQITVTPKVKDGLIVPDTGRDILKIAVVERHRGTGNIGIGFVRGFGLKKGALASSVAHDSHNVIVVGLSDDELFAAVKEVERMNGGMAAVCDGKVLAALPLPIAGLMSQAPLADVAENWKALRQAAHALGAALPEPFMTLSFLALPVIPELRLTDRGLVDVGLFDHVSVYR
jgi:adenine deaminase